MALVAGRTVGFYTLLVATLITIYYARRPMSTLPKIRPILALQGMEEAIGRATELGQPIHFTPGTASLVSEDAPQVFAALSILEMVGRSAARKGNGKIIVTVRFPEVMPLAQEALRSAYAAESRTDLYSDDMVRFLSSAQFAYAAGTIAIMEREKVAANFMIGSFIGEALILAEVGNKIGAIQVAGCARLGQIPFLVAACDYSMIGDELFAAAAIATNDPVQIANIRAQDVMKAIMILILIGGFVLRATGVANISKILLK